MKEVKTALAHYKLAKENLEHVIIGKFPTGCNVYYLHGNNKIKLKIIKHLHDCYFLGLNEESGNERKFHISNVKEWRDYFKPKNPMALYTHIANQTTY